jgi:outer membrane biogenesis lipoprotein LolB
MKNSLKLLFAVTIIASFLLTACAPPPPPVSKAQLETAEQEAIRAEKVTSELKSEMNSLDEQTSAKKEELESLKRYQAELNAGK